MSDLDPLIEKLKRAKLPYGIARDKPEVLARVKPTRDALERAANEFFASLAPPAAPRYQGDPSKASTAPTWSGSWLKGQVRAESLIASLEALAKGRSNALYGIDALHSGVVAFAYDGHKQWWHDRGARLIAGLLRSEPEIISTLKGRGVCVWEGSRASASLVHPADEMWRVVHVNWLEAHEDIFEFVLDTTPMGRRCRFCLITETPHSAELHPVQLEKRHGLTIINGVVSLVPGAIHTHEACQAHWLKWLELASKYQSREEAQKADAAAGRKGREGNVIVPRVEIDQPTRARR